MNANTQDFQTWLKTMDERARRCCQEDGGPEIITEYYAAKKRKGTWWISNGKAWWYNPVVVHEIQEYPDGTVSNRNYIEGVQLFKRRAIEYFGMRAVWPSELPNLLGISKVVYFDYRQTDEKGRAKRVVYDLREQQLEVKKKLDKLQKADTAPVQ